MQIGPDELPVFFGEVPSHVSLAAFGVVGVPVAAVFAGVLAAALAASQGAEVGIAVHVDYLFGDFAQLLAALEALVGLGFWGPA